MKKKILLNEEVNGYISMKKSFFKNILYLQFRFSDQYFLFLNSLYFSYKKKYFIK